MDGMSKKTAFTVLALFFLGGAASAQNLPPDQATLNAQTQAALNAQILQTQLNNLQTQQSLQQNDIRQQQLFNSMAPPAYQQQQPAFSPPPPATTP